MRLRPFTLALPAALALALQGSGAHAKPPKAPAADAPMVVSLPPDAIKRLKSGDLAQVKGALDDVRMSAKAGAAAVPAIAELLQQGLPPALTQAAIDAIADTEAEAGSAAVAWYTRDRNPGTRRSAVQALSRTRGPAAVAALRASLSDPDPGVRGLAATGLGSMKAKDAVGDLFTAFDHKVPEAAASIGQLCAGAECERFASKLGSVPFDVVTGGLDQILFRPASDVSDDLKIKVVGRVRELGTGEANRFLKDVQGKWPKDWSARVKQAIDQAVLATAASPGAGGGAP